ncbi:peptidase [Streptomyces sp. NPDC001380]|uniref:peptidase n=1 Tax=Streptomyces sp. NPDC001380 TaxID=3364566 RepID=UPI003678EDC3
MRTAHLLRTAAGLTAAGAALLAGASAPASAAPADTGTASPGTSGHAVPGTAGTSFLTAAALGRGAPIQLSASTGDYLYWAFGAAAGQTATVGVTVSLPPAANRHGAATWTVDVFDGLRRRQACTAGTQTAAAAADAATVSLDCTLRQVRSWAEPWSGDPLPGTYYVRLSATDLPEPDLGLPVRVEARVASEDGDAEPEGGGLRAPLVPAVHPGATLAPGAVPSAAPSAPSGPSAARPVEKARGWFSGISSRWIWTVGGGVLAALLGVAGYSLTRHPRRRPSAG